ncbi:MAG: hypothetical protein L3K02_01110 [Thermoplasmata archaeon]|nr:hypothetical protein [Thermoplasmata archaeon]
MAAASSPPHPSPGPTPKVIFAGHPPPTQPNETVTIQNRTVGNLSQFWGLGLDANTPFGTASAEVQGSPVSYYEWPAGKIADSFNMTNGELWTYGYGSPEGTNESQFVQWCQSISCHAILAVPGEINDSAAAAYDVAFTEQTLGFYPSYWQVGNEPSGWMHFNIPWTAWKTTDTSIVNPASYAEVVQNYSVAMRAVDPHLHLLGLPGVGAGPAPDTPWITATVHLNGPNLSAVAIHDYPAERGPMRPTLSGFFKTLLGSTAIAPRVVTDEAAVKSACPTCSPISLFVDEFNAGTGTTGTWQPYMQTYPEVPYVAAELVSMMQSNVSNADLYNLRSAYNGSLYNASGVAFPLDSLYAKILPHVDPTTLQTNVTGTANGVFADVSESGPSNSITLLAVNTNTTLTVRLNLKGSVFPAEGSFTTWRANNSTSSPNGTFQESSGFGATSSWLLPPLGVLLVSVCRSNASGSAGLYPVTFCETGLSPGLNWSVTVGSTTLWSTSATITFLEGNNSYPYTIGPRPNWTTPIRSGSILVAGAAASVTVPWTAVTYPVNFTENQLPLGTRWSVLVGGIDSYSTTPTIPVLLSNGTHHYSFGIVPGWTTLNLNRSGNVTVNATAVGVTVTWYPVTYNVTFVQSGLGGSTNWSVTLAGSTGWNTSGGPILFSEPNGTDPYSIGNVSGFIPDARSGAVEVQGFNSTVNISWAASAYAIEFDASGLANGTTWSVDLNGTPQIGAFPNFTYWEPSGSYSYSLGKVPGWSTPHYGGTVVVAGANMTVTVPWTQSEYNITFTETNLPGGTNWSVSLNHTAQFSTGRTIVFIEPNGSFPYVVPGVPGYYPNISAGSVVVNGTALGIKIFFPKTQFSVTFMESGLPGGTTWYVNITNHAPVKAFSPTQGILLPNASYNYSVWSTNSGYASPLPVGNFTVNGTRVWVNVTFARSSLVTFHELGLPNGTNWSVFVVNQTRLNSTTPDITFDEPAGTYRYVTGVVPGWTTLNHVGSVTAAGIPLIVNISWTVKAYTVGFDESGLPPGNSWSVILNGTAHGSSSTTVSFTEPNGTYGYQVPVVPGYRPSNVTGSVTVNGTDVTLTLLWTIVTYNVTFQETGLISPFNWSVTLSGVSNSSTTSTVSFFVPNGTYSFRIGGIAGWTTSFTGMLVVNGQKMTEPVLWSVTVYTVTFSESGLSNTTNWSVTLGGVTHWNKTGGAIQFSEPNNSYNYRLHAPGGWTTSPFRGTVTVDGTNVTVSVVWVVNTYLVTFEQMGLPDPTNWSVTLAGTTAWNSTGGPIVFAEGNGSYNYVIGPVVGWVATITTGTLAVAGSGITRIVTFVKTYSVTFEESGLPPGTAWTVTLGGVGETSEIEFNETNGSYPFSIAKVTGYVTRSYSGSIQVSGAVIVQTVAWTPVTYSVTFGETGLPSGTNWSVTLNGTTSYSNTSKISFLEIDGNYAYSMGLVPGFTPSPLGGSIVVDGKNLTKGIPFVVTKYTITFSESGLFPAGTLWSVTVDGKGYSSGSNLIEVQEPNGTYDYRYGLVPGWTTSNFTGVVTVAGQDVLVSVAWTAVEYTVTFSETGLPSGTVWSVTLNGVTASGMGSTLTFTEPNRTYSYLIGPVSGYDSSPGSGTLVVAGANQATTISFAPVVSPPPTNKGNATPSSILGVPAIETVGILGGIVIVALVAWALATRPGRKGKSPAARPPPPTPPRSGG